METTYITFDKKVKNGSVMGFGEVVKETEKAVLIHYEIIPVFSSGKPFTTSYDRACLIPKSVLQKTEDGFTQIKFWFVDKMKPFSLA